ncbi:MAG: aldehyde dehydrogenase [Clostridiales bacterium]|jgi:aldehyde dehydrogenase (NAD+)|nr:aldehyde dehydrogenase [Clostridiales bacterium]
MDFTAIVDLQRRFFASGRTLCVDFRIRQLRRIRRWILENDWAIKAALRTDLNKAPFESLATESGLVLDELRHILLNIRNWTRPKFVMSNLKNFPSYGRIHARPYGLALIMSPWNYPFMLTLVPLLSAIAAGNCAVVKPSAYAPATSSLIARMCEELFHPCFVAVVEGGRKENEGLLNQRFDKIFFTGSTNVGRVVMAAAAKNLTPITLELGGKSPCIVDETANLKLAARRIIWGKTLNAGQTCVAPDYLLVHESVKEQLIHELSAEICKQLGAEPANNNEYPKIINKLHFNRLLDLLKGENIAFGGGFNAKTLQIEPTIIDGPYPAGELMNEEIFGPILPVMTYSTPWEAAEFVNARPKPLAFYVFTSKKANAKFFIDTVSFGGGCVNDTIVHLSVPRLPFGGVGESGMGSHHGKAGFDAFTHYSSILHKSRHIDIPLRYQPYTDIAMKLLKLL